jgi:hypothetical protein
MSHRDESWRDVPGFEGFYEISSRERVRGVRRSFIRSNGCWYTVKPRVLSIGRDRYGLRSVLLSRIGTDERVYIHRVMETVFGTGGRQ